MENENNDQAYFQSPTFTVENLSCEISAYHSEEDEETPLF